MVYLQVDLDGQNRQLALGDAPVQIGRLEGNTLVLEDTLISRRHCIIGKTAAGFSLQDLGSSNGTYVNGERITQVQLHHGDTVSVGRFQIRFIDDSQPASPIAAPVPVQAAPASAVAGPEQLDESDLVDDTPDLFQGGNPNAADGMGSDEMQLADDHEAVLLRLAESLPDKSFGDHQISLVNARGAVSHPSTVNPTPQRANESGDAVRLLRLILLACFRTYASDIHVEPKEHLSLVRIRVDGTMVDLVKLDKGVANKLNSMIKVLADIDIAQRGIVQEGHFSSRLPDRRVDYRVSFAPSVFGQKLVIRILDAKGAPLRVDQLKLPQSMSDEILRAISLDSGVILVCGPTGSGKTTTLYSVLRTLDTNQRNVITIEDPVEIQINGVTQLPVNEEQGNTFAALLRSVLRQDPDVILVGEIRDPETAKTAMQAAITGHMVFSTLHTRDTIGTIFRLLDLGVEPYMLAQGLNLVIAQRLVRNLCPHCKTPAKLSSQQIEKVTAIIPAFKQSFTRRGCPQCMNTGFSGRRGVYEMLTTNDALRDVILHNRSNQAIQEALSGSGFQKLIHHGYQLVADGVTSLDEVDRAVG